MSDADEVVGTPSELLKPCEGTKASITVGGEYDHGADGVSQSGLKKFVKDPQKYWREHVKIPRDPRKPPSAAMQFGKDVEEFLFENRVPRDAICVPDSALNEAGHKRGPNWTAYLRDNNYDPNVHLLMKRREYEEHVGPMMKVRDNVMKHPRARKILFESRNERSVKATGVDGKTGLFLRGELDIVSSLNDGMICDVKSTKAPSLAGFELEIWDFGYHIQACFYQELVRQYTGELLPFVFIPVGNSGGHYVETYSVHEEWMELARPTIRIGLDRLAEAYETGNWQSRTHGRIHDCKPKPWMKKRKWEDEK